MIEVQSPHAYEQHPGKRVFLAGSIEMGRAEPWQPALAEALADLSDVVLLNPRREDWDSSWEQRAHDPQFKQQVEWELNGLEAADLIVMALLPGTKSPISLLELGLFVGKKPLLVYCPPDFWRMGNVEIVMAKYGGELFEDMDTWTAAIRTWLQALD